MRRAALVVIALAAVAVLAPASARTTADRVITVAHGPVTPQNSQYVDLGEPGPSVGDVRTYYLPLTQPKSSRSVGYLTGTLTTVAVDRPAAGEELRAANLVFVIGREADQIVVGGVAAYAQAAPAVSAKSSVVRPIVGGSGKYAGARGWVVSTHFADNTWVHVLHLMP